MSILDILSSPDFEQAYDEGVKPITPGLYVVVLKTFNVVEKLSKLAIPVYIATNADGSPTEFAGRDIVMWFGVKDKAEVAKESERFKPVGLKGSDFAEGVRSSTGATKSLPNAIKANAVVSVYEAKDGTTKNDVRLLSLVSKEPQVTSTVVDGLEDL